MCIQSFSELGNILLTFYLYETVVSKNNAEYLELSSSKSIMIDPNNYGILFAVQDFWRFHIG